MSLLKNISIKKAPLTTIMGLLNTLMFGLVFFGVFDQQTADAIMVIVNDFAATLGVSPTIVIVGTAMQSIGSIILMLAPDPEKPKVNKSGGNIVRYLLLLLIPAGLMLASCSKSEEVKPEDTRITKAIPESPGHNQLQDFTEYDTQYEQAYTQLDELQNYAMYGDPLPPKGIDSSANLKARLWWAYPGLLVFDISVASDTTIAQMNAMSVIIEYTGNYMPAQGQGFGHNLHPQMVNWPGVLLEVSSGQYSYISWYSISPFYVTSSTGPGDFPPGVCHIGVTGNSGTITFKVIEISKDGYNNYQVGKTEIQQ